MSTYNVTAGDTAVPVEMFNRFFCADIKVDVPTIIASDATLTANGYITANDIIQVWDIPASCWILGAAIETVTPCTATVTGDVGLAGGAELMGDVDLAAAAGTWDNTDTGDGYCADQAFGNVFAATDTLDIQFKVANCVVGQFWLHIIGVWMPRSNS